MKYRGYNSKTKTYIESNNFNEVKHLDYLQEWVLGLGWVEY